MPTETNWSLTAGDRDDRSAVRLCSTEPCQGGSAGALLQPLQGDVRVYSSEVRSVATALLLVTFAILLVPHRRVRCRSGIVHFKHCLFVTG